MNILEEADRLASAVRAENLARHVDWCSQVRRDTGGEGEDRMVDYIVDTLSADGVPVDVHEFEAFLSYPRRASLVVTSPEGRQIRCLTHSFARSTGPHGVVGDLKFVPGDDLAQGAGRVTLVDGLASTLRILDASRAGVTALIFANAESYIHNMIGTTIWGGAPTLDLVDRLPNIPVVSIAHEDGEALKEILSRGRVQVKLETEVDTGWRKVRLPEVRIDGAKQPEKFLLVGGHYCSWEVGTTDNSTGVADILELARIFWNRRESLERSVRFVWWPGHSHGRYAGSTWYADTFFEDLSKNCMLYHNIDSPGVRGATKYILRHTSAEIEAFGRDIIERYTDQRDPEVHRPSRSADQSFLAIGVPTSSLYSFLPDDHPDRKPWTGGCAGAWWWHTECDTRDKADIDILAKDCALSVALIHGYTNSEVLPLDLLRAAQESYEFIETLAKDAAGHIDLATSVTKARAVVDAVTSLDRLRSDATGAEATRLNEVMMRMSRIVNPVRFTSQDRFAHEPADMTPLMRARKSAMFPGLSKAAGLAALEGTQEYGFLLTQVRRQVNRFNDSCDRAVELASGAMAA